RTAAQSRCSTRVREPSVEPSPWDARRIAPGLAGRRLRVTAPFCRSHNFDAAAAMLLHPDIRAGLSPMNCSRHLFRNAMLAALPALVIAGGALAQDRGGLFDNMFNRGEPQQDQSRRAPQNEDSELSARVARLEGALRQLTGAIEQLQHQNQTMEMQLQQLGARSGNPVPPAVAASPNGSPTMGSPTALPPPGQRSDAFDPNANPNAPGAPRTLNGEARVVAPAPGAIASAEPVIGAPNGRDAGAPLDLNAVAA